VEHENRTKCFSPSFDAAKTELFVQQDVSSAIVKVCLWVPWSNHRTDELVTNRTSVYRSDIIVWKVHTQPVLWTCTCNWLINVYGNYKHNQNSWL